MKKEEKSSNSNILLLIVAISTILFTIIGTTFAYFTTQVKSPDGPTSVLVKSADLGIIFNNDNKFDLGAITPGWSGTKYFSITNTSTTGTDPLTYNIIWEITTNGFVTGDLKYTLTSSDGGGNIPLANVPSSTQTILSSQSIAPGVTHTYALDLSFLNTSEDQTNNMGQTFLATLKIETARVEM